MKKIFSIGMIGLVFLTSLQTLAQDDKSKRPSPPATISQKIGEATVTISYGQPSVKGRTIGVDLEPMQDKVWRAGANEATVFETDKDLMIGGKVLPKGKYGFFILAKADTWTIIFNKTWYQWGAFKYKEADDVLRDARDVRPGTFTEKLTYKLDAAGNMNILWGDKDVYVLIQEKK